MPFQFFRTERPSNTNDNAGDSDDSNATESPNGADIERAPGSNNETNGQTNAASTQTWWKCVLTVAFIVVMFTGVTFALGAANFFSGTTKEKLSLQLLSLLDDTTFFVLLSQTFPSILTSFFEVTKLIYTDNTCLRDRAEFLTALVFAAGLSLAAPIVYGTSDRTEPWVHVQTMILNVFASLATIIAGMISVFEARHSKAVDDAERATSRSKIDELEQENKKLKDEIQALEQAAAAGDAIRPPAPSQTTSRQSLWSLIRNRGRE